MLSDVAATHVVFNESPASPVISHRLRLLVCDGVIDLTTASVRLLFVLLLFVVVIEDATAPPEDATSPPPQARNGIYADHLIIQCLANVLEVDIIIIQSNEPDIANSVHSLTVGYLPGLQHRVGIV